MPNCNSVCVFVCVSAPALQLKLQHRPGVLEELERSLLKAEDMSPGVTDKMVGHILERVKR